MITLCGKQFNFSSLNADDLDRMESARARYSAKSTSELERSQKQRLSYADRIRIQCRVLMDFFDEVLGEGSATALGLNGSNYDKALLYMKQLTDAVQAEQKMYSEMLRESMPTPAPAAANREQRRAQKKRKKHRGAPVSFPAQPAAAQMVERGTPRQPAGKSFCASWPRSIMADLLLDTLPTEWAGRSIDWDFRPMVWLSNQYLRGRSESAPEELSLEALRRFYVQPIPPQEAPEAFAALLKFYAGGKVPEAKEASAQRAGPPQELAFDYACDAPTIVAAFQQAYHIDLTTSRVHWWRFRALFSALPECTTMARIMSYRTMDLSGMQGKELQRYAELKETFALPKSLRRSQQPVTLADHNAAFLARFRHNER